MTTLTTREIDHKVRVSFANVGRHIADLEDRLAEVESELEELKNCKQQQQPLEGFVGVGGGWQGVFPTRAQSRAQYFEQIKKVLTCMGYTPDKADAYIDEFVAFVSGKDADEGSYYDCDDCDDYDDCDDCDDCN